jgi:hypothetical protein
VWRLFWLADVVAAQPGQHDIEHDERGLKFGDGGNGFIAATARGGLETFALEDFFETEEDVRIVLDD